MAQGARLEHLLGFLPEDPVGARSAVARLGGAESLAEEARLLGLLPLLHHYLPELALSREEELGRRFHFARISRGTVEVTRMLAASGIGSIALKGAALATQLYPAPWLRPTSDIDILVRPAELEAARAACERAGWKLHQGPPESVFELSHHMSFVGPGRQLLELHFTPASAFQSRFDVAAIFERSKTVVLDTGEVGVLGDADALAHSCVHALHHGLGGVKWLFDIKLQVASGRVDWAAVRAIARAARVSSATGMALAEARRRVGAAVLDDALRDLGPGLVRRGAVRQMERIPLKVGGVYLLSLALADRVTLRWLEEAAARPVDRVARLLGREQELRALVRRVAQRLR